MIPVSLSVRLHLYVSSSLALSLPQSSPLYPVRLDSSLLRGSRGRSRAVHRVRFAVKVRRKRCHWSPIQPLRQALFILKGLTPPLTQGRREPHSVAALQPLHRGAENAHQNRGAKRGSRGRSRAAHRINAARYSAFRIPHFALQRPFPQKRNFIIKYIKWRCKPWLN